MYNRAETVDKNFRKLVGDQNLPTPKTDFDIRNSHLHPEELVDLFESQVISRHMDIRARELKQESKCYYTIGSSGHEGNAVLGKVFRLTDMPFLHYRSGAFFIQRAKQDPLSTPIYDMLRSLGAAKSDPIAGGRHKVFGSKPLGVPPQTSTIASHLPKAVGAALSIGRAHELGLETKIPKDGVAVCTFGDASANHSTALGAINTASWVAYQDIKMPLVFVCEDNGLGISVPTPDNWIKMAFSNRPTLKYISCDGLNLVDAYEKTRAAAHYARTRKKPVFLHMKTVRLLGHAGSDVETTYRSLHRVEDAESNDPLLFSARILLENRILSKQDILKLYDSIRERIFAVSQQTKNLPTQNHIHEVGQSITACASPRPPMPQPPTDQRKTVFSKEWAKMKSPQHMAKLINWGLTDIMNQYPNSLVFGEDVAEKGGVYHVTDSLQKRFGKRRVFNSPLDEQSILGTAIGLAHNTFVPIPEIQFLAYVHNAEDQIRGEAATLPFFSQGQFTNPMVLRIAGLAYQRGFGGHFHNDNSLAVFRDIPGLILAVPSNGKDAVTMLRTCMRKAHEEGRVCIFIEPIALYMTKDLHEDGDKQWCFDYPEPSEETPVGEFATYGESDIVIVTYGNGTYYSLRAQKELREKHGIDSEVLDLRWVAPLNKKGLARHLKTKKKVLFVEECRTTGSLAESFVASMVQILKDPRISFSIHGAEDCFIPLGPAATAGLPNKDTIVEHILEMVGLS